ncbi:MAG: hypothetical protein ROO73_04800 [Roseivirga sp.]
MYEEKGNEAPEEDTSHLPAEVQRLVARSKERMQHYQQQAEEEEKKVEEEKQQHAEEVQQIQRALATNMIRLGVPAEEVADTLGISVEQVQEIKKQNAWCWLL